MELPSAGFRHKAVRIIISGRRTSFSVWGTTSEDLSFRLASWEQKLREWAL